MFLLPLFQTPDVRTGTYQRPGTVGIFCEDRPGAGRDHENSFSYGDSLWRSADSSMVLGRIWGGQQPGRNQSCGRPDESELSGSGISGVLSESRRKTGKAVSVGDVSSGDDDRGNIFRNMQNTGGKRDSPVRRSGRCAAECRTAQKPSCKAAGRDLSVDQPDGWSETSLHTGGDRGVSGDRSIFFKRTDQSCS